MLRIAVPNKGALSGPAMTLLAEAGYRQRTDPKDLSVLDAHNQVEFFFLRPKDVAIYVGSGDVDLGITGRDMALESRAEVSELLQLGTSRATFRYAAPVDGNWTVARLEGKRIATSYPNLVLDNLDAQGISAEVVKLDGAVEIAIQLGVADAIADVVDSGRTLRQHGLAPFGEILCDSEGVLVQRAGSDPDDRARRQFAQRLQGVVFGQQYLMLDYDCPRVLLEQAVKITPGIESPTISPLADDNWVAVRAMVPRRTHNELMDELAELGAKAIIASDIRSCRAM